MQFETVLSSAMLKHLRTVFGANSAFWQQHGYNELEGCAETGYFSYLHSLLEPRSSSLDIVAHQILEILRPHFPQLSGARFVEWWAHCRPHQCGHQLHFDSDNEAAEGARHPLCSVVLYLEAPHGLGGPTLVLD